MFAKGRQGKAAFVVDGKIIRAGLRRLLAVKEGKTIVLNDDVQLTVRDKLPDVGAMHHPLGRGETKV